MTVTFAQATVLERSVGTDEMRQNYRRYLFADAGKTTSFSALVYRLRNPADPGVTADLEHIIGISFTRPIIKNKLTALWLGSTRMTS